MHNAKKGNHLFLVPVAMIMRKIMVMMIYHFDGDGDEDKHNLRRRKHVSCIERKVGLNFAQVTKLVLPHDDDDDDDDYDDDEMSRKVPKRYSWILNSFTFTLTKLQNFIRRAPCAFQMEMVSFPPNLPSSNLSSDFKKMELKSPLPHLLKYLGQFSFSESY